MIPPAIYRRRPYQLLLLVALLALSALLSRSPRHSYRGSVNGISAGMTRNEIEQLAGPGHPNNIPWQVEGDTLYLVGDALVGVVYLGEKALTVQGGLGAVLELPDGSEVKVGDDFEETSARHRKVLIRSGSLYLDFKDQYIVFREYSFDRQISRVEMFNDSVDGDLSHKTSP